LGKRSKWIVQLTLESHTDRMIEDFGKAIEEIPEVLEAFLYCRKDATDHRSRLVAVFTNR